MARRAHISLKTLLASELLRRRAADGSPWVPYEHAKLMSADQVISLFERHHNILHAHGGPDTHWNVELVPIMEHRRLTATRDVPCAAKVKRLRERTAVCRAEPSQEARTKRRIPSRVNPWPPRGSRRLRPWRPHGH